MLTSGPEPLGLVQYDSSTPVIEAPIMQPNPVSRRGFLQASTTFLSAAALADRLVGQEPPASVPTVNERIQQEAAAAELSMQFTGATADECQAWQAKFSARLRSLLGPHRPPSEWKTETEAVVELDDHTRHELILRAEGHADLPVYLLLPKQAEGPLPGVLALHGHGAYGYDPIVGKIETPGVDKAIAGAHYDYGLQFVRRGYAVADTCFTPFGRPLDDRQRNGKTDPCAVTFVRLQLLGKVLMAENLRDALWSLDLLARHDAVDPKRLGCVGLSYGGRMTMLTTALEPRIQVADISGALNVMQERVSHPYSCGAQVIPGLLQYGDVPEIGGLIAPRPCVWETGSRDGLIVAGWSERALERIGRAYRACAAADQLRVDRFEGGHRFNGAVALGLFDEVLRPGSRT